jgi:biotin carboxyl carrier protein
MTLDIELNGRTRLVIVEPEGQQGRFRVTIDGSSSIIDAERVGEFGLSLLFEDGSESCTFQLAPGGGRGELLANASGRTASLIVNGRRRARGAGDAAGGHDGEQKISAPMPGRVVRVLVAPGDQVAARQAVAVVEAMKMENELRSPRAGRVKDVAVAPGTSVEAGRVLVVVE